MPVTVHLKSGARAFKAPLNPLTIDDVVKWLDDANHKLDRLRGDGLMLVDFLARTTTTYGLADQAAFLKDLKDYATQGIRPGQGSPSSRVSPESVGVFLAPPKSDAMQHAVDRMNRQLRLFAILALLKCKHHFGSATGNEVMEASTRFQHGSGQVGEAAAHKIMATYTVAGRRLEDIVTDSAQKTFLIFLQSETSLLKSYYNNADSAVETDIRPVLLQIAADIVSGANPLASPTKNDFAGYVQRLWDKLHDSYVKACRNAHYNASKRMFDEADNYRIRARLQSIPEPQLIEAKRKSAEAALATIVLDGYLDVAVKTTACPLRDAEIGNLYDIFHPA